MVKRLRKLAVKFGFMGGFMPDGHIGEPKVDIISRIQKKKYSLISSAAVSW